jgi:hypothetical protein
MLRRREHNRPVIAEIDVHSRFELQFSGKFGIHASAGSCERLEDRRSFDAAVDQHAAGGVRCLAAGFSALDYQNSRAALAERDSEREANDASADYDYVPSLHLGIVKEGRRSTDIHEETR